MNFTKFSIAIFIISNLKTGAQILTGENSRILRTNASDTAFFHVEMEEASYDIMKNSAPYYILSKVTGYNEDAIATLVVKKTQQIKEPYASVISKFFSPYISNTFLLEKSSSLSRRQTYHHYKLFPFRLNESGKLEEIISYDVNWQVTYGKGSAAKGTDNFAKTSVLATGTWYKVGITQTGIHKISKSMLSSLGINPNTFDHTKLRVFGNGGKMIPERNKTFRYDDLVENPLKIVLNEEGKFDYALFYASGTTEWINTKSKSGLRFKAIKNLYSDTSFYFVNADLETGKRIQSYPSSAQSPDFSSNSYDYYNFHEENIINFGKSGRAFFGEYFDLTNSYNFTWNDGDFITDTLITEVSVAATYKDPIQFQITGSGINEGLTIAGTPFSQYANWAQIGSVVGKAINSNPAEITITVSKQTSKSLGWLDKVTINARRLLSVSTKQYCFRDSRAVGANKRCNFSIPGSPSGANLWNVTDPLNPFEQQYNVNGSGLDFTCPVDSLNEFCIVPNKDFYTPVVIGKLPGQNLHALTAANYLIITHPLFLKEAEYMGKFHQQKDGLTYAVATIDQIYNEFSSGKQDISAIRDFIRMLYTRTIDLPEDQQLKYVLLMGDGSFNNKSRNTLNNSNFIPTYESNESLDPISSIVTDDFYGLMDPEEGYFAEDDGKAGVDVGIGRFPCRTVVEVKAIISKIENYYRKDLNYVSNSINGSSNSLYEAPFGDWRTWVCFMADDEDNATHMKQSNKITNVLKGITQNYNIDNIFLDAYQRFSTPGGFRYPDAAEEFLKRIAKGTLIFNYTGHGGEVGLTAERMIDMDIINNFDNFNKLPLWITATCEFSRYDDPSRTSAGEVCLLNPNGGAIALYTTCRVAFSDKNERINTEIIRRLFTRLPNGKWPTLGDAIADTKATVGQNFYFANFHLLGDPALRLAYPEDKVVTTMINNLSIDANRTDTLNALSKITVQGYVADNAGNKLTNFNGLVYPSVFDKENLVTCLMNSKASGVTYSNTDTSKVYPFQFKLQKNLLYKGKTLAKNGEFSFSFIVPKDISFAIGPGKIGYYATDGTKDAVGYYNQLVVGGSSSKEAFKDNAGPEVSLYLNDEQFTNGGLTNEKPILIAKLLDSSGINTLGTGIGHDISVILDANNSKPVILNDYYESNLNSYQGGRVRYPYKELAEGPHTLTFKVWDIQNNSSTVSLDFIVANSEELALKQVLNYPNPFTTRTKFMFQHNQACNPLKVTVQVYTVTGKVVKTLQTTTSCDNGRPEGIDWDGRDDYGDKLARGVYIYRVAIIDVNNKKAEKLEKLVILN